MEFFENLKDKITKTSRVVAKKSNEIVEITKLKAAIAAEEAEVDKIFRLMGESLYEAYKTGGESAASLEETCEEIDAKYERIEELTERISELKNTKVCPVCKKEMERDAAFCSVCGERF